MTEKRFTINLKMENKREWLLNNYAIAKLTDNSDKTFYFIIDSVDEIENLCKKINSLVDKNEQLKVENGEMEDYLGRLEEENEQLKQENKGLQSELEIWKKDITHSNNIINRLNDENEQLKQLVNEAEDIIICQCTPYYQRIWENIKKNINGDME